MDQEYIQLNTDLSASLRLRCSMLDDQLEAISLHHSMMEQYTDVTFVKTGIFESPLHFIYAKAVIKDKKSNRLDFAYVTIYNNRSYVFDLAMNADLHDDNLDSIIQENIELMERILSVPALQVNE